MWTGLFVDLFERTHETLHELLPDLDAEELAWRPGPEANPIGWICWHALRVQDDHLAHLAGRSQVWQEHEGSDPSWVEIFAQPYPAEAIGYGHTSEEVAAFSADSARLLGYADAVHARTLEVIDQLAGDDLQRIVDRRWDPPVTLGVRLVSVVNDVTQHVGQAAYLVGLLASR